MNHFALSHPWAFTGLSLLLLPVLRSALAANAYPAVAWLPKDHLSSAASLLLTLLYMATIVLLVLGIAGLNRSEQTVERIGNGANMVLLFDRSTSMDQTFAGKPPGGGEESKSGAAKRLLLDFIGRRPHDRIGVVSYSTAPLYVMPLTENKQAVAAAIAATATPGLAYTNISKGLAMALSFYRGTAATTGARIILLVSDGAAAIDSDDERKLRQWFYLEPVRLYWIFLRGKNSPDIHTVPEDSRDDNAQAMPERYLHLFFKGLNIPYLVYQADNPDAMEKAVAEIHELEDLPLHYTEKIPRQDLSGPCYLGATLLLMILCAAKLSEVRL